MNVCLIWLLTVFFFTRSGAALRKSENFNSDVKKMSQM